MMKNHLNYNHKKSWVLLKLTIIFDILIIKCYLVGIIVEKQ